MFHRACLSALLVAGVALAIAGCTKTSVDVVTVSPATQSVTVGQTAQLTATGTIDHGSHPATTEDVTSQVTWTSSAPSVATVSSAGVATAVAVGSATITATLSGAAPSTATITVTPSTTSTGGDITSLTIIPATQSVASPGDTTQFIATGTTSSGATQNVSSQVAWSSSSVQVATISASGLATAVGKGTATITAVFTNTDKTVATGTATFTVSTGGSALGDVASISVIPGTQSVPSNDTAQFIAIGTTALGTTENLTGSVSWSSSSAQVAAINTSGLATAAVPGTATITALFTNADKTVATGTSSLTVTASAGGSSSGDVTSISVIPGTQSDSVGDQTQFIAIGTTLSGATENVGNQVAWKSSNEGIATIDPTSGFATAVGAGTATITALLTNADNSVATGTSSLKVTAPTGGSAGGDVTSISVIPGNQSVAAPGDTTQFLAIGTTSSGATENVTASSLVQWKSSSPTTQGSPGIANIDPSTGLATAVSQGTATITALLTNADKTVATGTSTFTVQSPESSITKLAITPTTQSLSASGQTAQLIALGTSGATGLLVDVTSMTGTPGIKWTSSVPTIASVSTTGLVTGQSVGQSTVTAVWTNTDGTGASVSALVTVTSTVAPEPLLSLTVIPSAITVGNLQDTGNFLAIGTFSVYPYTRDLTDSVTWTSSSPSVFPINSNTTPGLPNPGAPAGVVTAYGTGSTTIIAEYAYQDPNYPTLPPTIQTATASFSCPLVLTGSDPTCYPGSQASALLETVTVYNEGLNTTNWLVTAPSATGTANVIHCGPGWTGAGGSVCVATYPIGATVTLTASQPTATTGTFGGWSSSCTTSPSSISPNPSTAAGPNTCTLVPNTGPYSATNPAPTNITVGAIFN